MPRFSPGLEEGLALSTSRLIDVAYGVRAVDEARLTALSKTLLLGVRGLKSSGMTRDEVIADLGIPGAGADAEHERRLHEFIHASGLSDVRVFCVTTDPDSPAMWEAYAAGGTGLQVELRHVPEESTALLAARKVDYAAEPPPLGSAEDFFLYGETDRLAKASLQAIISTKRQEWSYQAEWRVVWWLREPDESLYTEYPFLPQELASIRFGPRVSDEFRAAAVELARARYPHCEVLT